MTNRRLMVAALVVASLAAPASAHAGLVGDTTDSIGGTLDDAAGLPVNTELPRVTGTPVVGETLMVNAGSWLYADGGPHYQWSRCDAQGEQCAAIGGATASTFVATADDALSTIRATVTMSNLLGSTTAETEPTGLVESAPAAGDEGSAPGPEDAGDSLTDPVDVDKPTAGGGTPDASRAPEAPAPRQDGGPAAPPAAGGEAGAGSHGAVVTRYLQLVSPRRRIHVGRLGTIHIGVAPDRLIGTKAPLRLSLRAAKGVKMRAVHYRLGAGAPRTSTPPGHVISFAASRLSAGRQRLSVRLVPRRGRPITVAVQLRLAEKA